jgi:hypothetical protein
MGEDVGRGAVSCPVSRTGARILFAHCEPCRGFVDDSDTEADIEAHRALHLHHQIKSAQHLSAHDDYNPAPPTAGLDHGSYSQFDYQATLPDPGFRRVEIQSPHQSLASMVPLQVEYPQDRYLVHGYADSTNHQDVQAPNQHTTIQQHQSFECHQGSQDAKSMSMWYTVNQLPFQARTAHDTAQAAWVGGDDSVGRLVEDLDYTL